VLVIGVPGDREVDFRRLEAGAHPSEVAMFEAEDFAAHPGLARGYIGPQVLKDLGYRYAADPRVVVGSAWVTGANEADKHAVNVVAAATSR
jgi:prolyl-tRNA synthetase